MSKVIEDCEDAKNLVLDLYSSLEPIVQEIVDHKAEVINRLINEINDKARLTNEEIRDYMLKLSTESAMFASYKDLSQLKSECATAIMKENQALAYNGTDGTQVVRTNASLLATVDNQVVNMLYSAVSNLMKTKLDETHRMVNTLNSILISRAAEAKLNEFTD